MKRVLCIIMILAALFAAGCETIDGAADSPEPLTTQTPVEMPAPTPTPTPTPAPTPTPTPEPALYVKVLEACDFLVEPDAAAERTVGARRLPKDAEALLIGEVGEFYEVEYAKLRGYIEAEHAEIAGIATEIHLGTAHPEYPETQASTPQVRAVTELSYLRVYPYAASERVAGCLEIPRGAEVTVIGSAGSFYHVEYGEYSGYITGTSFDESTGGGSTGGGSGEYYAPPSGAFSAAYVRQGYLWAKSRRDDTRGYIAVPGTNIAYPIMYDPSGQVYYHNHTWLGESSTRGSIYLYREPTAKLIHVIGHNSRNSQTMFHHLHTVQNRLKSNPSGNKTVYMYLNGRTTWQIWAFYETPADEPASTLTQIVNTLNPSQEWIDYQLSRSEASLGVSVSAGEQLAVLITCGDRYDSFTAQSRLYVFLKALG